MSTDTNFASKLRETIQHDNNNKNNNKKTKPGMNEAYFKEKA